MSMNMLKVWEEMTNDYFRPDTIWCEEVIISTVKRKGLGIDSDPVRIITQVFTKKGHLIAEFDPHLDKKNSPPIG